MRRAPTRNKQCIVEEEKTEITGMFIEPGFKKRRNSFRSFTYVFCYTVHHLYAHKLIVKVLPYLRPFEWLIEVLCIFSSWCE